METTLRKATIFLDGVVTTVCMHLERALRDLRESFKCRLGMKSWVDVLCLNQADVAEGDAHFLRVK